MICMEHVNVKSLFKKPSGFPYGVKRKKHSFF